MHHEFLKIEELLNYALLTPDSLGKGLYIAGKVDSALAQSIEAAIPVRTVGFRITIDHSSILHAFRQHGHQTTEALRGQLPVEADDILRLPEWLTCPDRVEDAGRKPGEPHCLRFLRVSNNELTTAILNVRTGRLKQQLSLKTMYKKRLTT